MHQKLESHHFRDEDGNPDGGQAFAPGLSVAWQRGPLGRGQDRREPNGCYLETVIRAALDRLEFLQTTRFSCPENEQAMDGLAAALAALASRTALRELRGAEGTHRP